MIRNDQFDISRKRVLLVGATGLLGRVYSKELSLRGCSLAIADLPSSGVLTLAGELSGNAKGFEIDVTDEASVITCIKNVENAFGGLDAAIINSAVTGQVLMNSGDPFAPFEELRLSLFQSVMNVNVAGTFLVSREAGRVMKRCGGGSLITISSIYGIVGPDHRIYEDQPFKSFAAYSASKAAVLGLTRWMATWWAKDGIRVNSITPGGVFNDHNKSFVDAYGRKTPLGRMANREELSGMVVYLVSDASSYCTGQNFIVDGGFSAW